MGRMWRPGRDIKTQTRFPTENRYLYRLDSEARIIIYLMIAGVQFKCRYKVRCCSPSGHVTLAHPGDASPHLAATTPTFLPPPATITQNSGLKLATRKISSNIELRITDN